MAAFVLVHGSGQNASSWLRVSRVLSARGHDVQAPDLPKNAPGWTLESFAARIAESIQEPHTVVVAHSLSGAFLPLVPRVRACSLLVFLAAVVPEPGKSVRDQFTEDRTMFSPEWIDAGPRWFNKSQEEGLAKQFLFHDCDEQTLPWALSTMEMLGTRDLVTEPAPFTEWPSVPAVSIVATEDRTLSPEWGRRISRRVLGREAIEVRSGHCPHVSKAQEIADVLEHLASEPDR